MLSIKYFLMGAIWEDAAYEAFIALLSAIATLNCISFTVCMTGFALQCQNLAWLHKKDEKAHYCATFIVFSTGVLPLASFLLVLIYFIFSFHHLLKGGEKISVYADGI